MTRNELVERFLDFAVNVFKLEKELCKTYSGRHIYGQAFHSATSVGANYEEVTAAESKNDFIHKMQIALKELKETYYWLRLIKKSELINKNSPILAFLLQENLEFINILSKAIKTTKSKI
jgi:four helix bundle protein